MTTRCAYCGNDGYLVDYEYEVPYHGRWLPRSVMLHLDCVARWEKENGINSSTPTASPIAFPSPPKVELRPINDTGRGPLNGGRGPQVGIPFMITAAMKRALCERGYSDKEISEMTPAEAHELLAPPPSAADDATRKQGDEPHPAVKPRKSKSRDTNDLLLEGGPEAVREMSDTAKPAEPSCDKSKRNQSSTPGTWRDNLINPQKLCDEQFPEVRYVVPGIIPEGVTLLASRPKLGKSWLILQITTAVANGTITLATGDQLIHGDAAYLALEDNKRRLQRRLHKYFGDKRETWPKRLTFFTTWRRLDQGGIGDLREWCKSVKKPTLIAIDTLKKVRKPKGRNQSDYDADYEACEGLIELAKEFPGLSIIVAHHDRKMDADDVFDTVSGTLGLTGGVDTIAVLKRSAKGTTLHVEGRDLVDAIEKAVSFDRETCRWQILGEAADVQRSAERSRVLTVLRNAPEGLSVTELIGLAGLGGSNAAYLLLGRMAEAGEVERVKRGIYGLAGTRANLSLKKVRQKDRQKPKPLKSQEDDNLSVDLSHPPNRQKSSPGAEQ